MEWPQHIAAKTVHVRKGDRPRRFTYSVDYVLLDPRAQNGPRLFSRNRFNLLSVFDSDHGGPRGDGVGVTWAEGVFAEHGLTDVKVLLLTQPRFLGTGFNPVSFWLAFRAGDLMGVISEVNNTFGDRHSYVCIPEDGTPIQPESTMSAQKLMHVSPFQEIKGSYSFNFNILEDAINIVIDLKQPGAGVLATLDGERRTLTSRRILAMLVKRPLGSVRTVILIYWQALLLKFRGETYLRRPAPPEREVS